MNNKKGFTIVELLAVIAIVAILATAAGIAVVSIMQRQRQKLAYTAEQNIADAALSFYTNKGNQFVKACTNEEGSYIVISQKNIEEVNKYLRETKYSDISGEQLYNEVKSYSNLLNREPSQKYELKDYIKVKDYSCYNTITVGELMEKGLISDVDGMCNKASLVIIYRRADAKNTAGILESIQEAGICKSNRKEERGPVITINPYADLSFSSGKHIKVDITTESTNLKPNFTMRYAWSKNNTKKPADSEWKNLDFTNNETKKASATIDIDNLNEIKYLWIKSVDELDDKKNKISTTIAGPYAFLTTPIVSYKLNGGNDGVCPPTKTVVFTRPYGKNVSGVPEPLCEPTRTGYDFDGWAYADTDQIITDDSIVNDPNNHDLNAKWKGINYTVTLNGNGATTNANPSSVTIEFGTSEVKNTPITIPIKKFNVSGFGLDSSRKSNGATVSSTATLTSTYTFDGWTTTQNGSTLILSKDPIPVLQPNVTGYTDANGIWEKPGNSTVYAKWVNNPIKLPTITKTGYECGWTTSSTGTTVQYASGADYTPNANTVLYGVCEPNQYKIVYIANHSLVDTSTTTADTICKYDEECTIRKSGYKLVGGKWYIYYWTTTPTDTNPRYKGGSKVKNLTTVKDGIVNLYGQWYEYLLKVTYNGNGDDVTWCGNPSTKYYMDEDNKNAINREENTQYISRYSYDYHVGSTGNPNDPIYGVYDYNAVESICFSRKGYTVPNKAEWNTATDGTGNSVDQAKTDYYGGPLTDYLLNNTCSLKTSDCYVTLYVNWKVTNYSISYTLNSGSISGTNPTSYNINTADFTLKNPSRSSYTFMGWSGTGVSGLSKSVTVKKGSTGNRAYTANWCQSCTTGNHANCSVAWESGSCKYTTSCESAAYTYQSGANTYNPICKTKQYTITYTADSSTSNIPSSQTKNHGTDIKLSSTKPTKTNYTFKTWNTKSDGSGTSYAPGATYSTNANLALNAQWCRSCANSYCTLNTSNCTYTTTCPTGYTLTGGSGTYNPTCTINSYTLTYNSNGGSACSPGSVTKTYGSAWGTLCSPTRDGYQFMGWKNGSTTVTSTSTATANITVTAVWKEIVWQLSSPSKIEDTIEHAISEANSGATITLLKDKTDNSTASTNKKLTVDLNGKILKRNADITFSGSDTFGITNGTLRLDNASIRVNSGTVNISNMLIGSQTSNFTIVTKAKLNITNTKTTSTNGGIQCTGSGTVTIFNEAWSYSIVGKNKAGVELNGTCTMTLTGGVIRSQKDYGINLKGTSANPLYIYELNPELYSADSTVGVSSNESSGIGVNNSTVTPTIILGNPSYAYDTNGNTIIITGSRTENVNKYAIDCSGGKNISSTNTNRCYVKLNNGRLDGKTSTMTNKVDLSTQRSGYSVSNKIVNGCTLGGPTIKNLFDNTDLFVSPEGPDKCQRLKKN